MFRARSIRHAVAAGLFACASSAFLFATAAQPPAFKPSLAGMNKAIAAENYAEAKRHADGLMQVQLGPEDRTKASVAYGRVLLGLSAKDEAKKYISAMKTQKLDGAAQATMVVYEAWLTALDGKQDAAIKSLEAILSKNQNDVPTLEAADVLAMLYMAKGERDNAKRAVDYGLKSIKYASLKTDYLETLLKNRLKSNINSPEAQRAYDAAEKLRQQGKFTEAGQAFTQLRTQYPRTEWAQAAGFRIGQCLVGLDRAPQAIDHWKAFVKEQPDGPWRGQARVALVDAILETKLDLKAATEQSLAATTSLGKSREKEDQASWDNAAFDIHLRQGIVSLVDGRFDAAVLGFEEAKKLASSKGSKDTPRPLAGEGQGVRASHSPDPRPLTPVPSSLDRLIEAAQKRSPLLPEELTVGDPRAVTALSLGNVFSLLHHYETAQKFFALPLTGPTAARSAAHRSFAQLGLARATAGQAATADKKAPAATKPAPGKPATAEKSPSPQESLFAQAKSLYQQSLKEYAKGTWHDETLRELAMLIERLAEDKHAAAADSMAQAPAKPGEKLPAPASGTAASKLPAPAGKAAGGEGGPPVQLTVAQREQLAKALRTARAEALPYWTELPKRYADSQHMPQALYHVGVLATESEKSDEALAAFEQLTQKFPDSLWTGDAQVRLIDVKLEQQFDLDGAAKLAVSAVAWYERKSGQGPEVRGQGSTKQETSKSPNSSPRPLAGEGQGVRGLSSNDPPAKNPVDAALRTLKEVGYDIYVRAGLVEYLSERPERAVTFFEKAKPLQPARNLVVVQGTIPTGIERLIEVAKTGKSLTPEIVRKGDDKARLILMLADVYHAGEQWKRSLDLCTKVINNVASKATREQRSWAYFTRARNYHSQDGAARHPDSEISDYLAAANVAPTAEWADRAMLLAANVFWNDKHDSKAAVAMWQRTLEKYPHSAHADRCAFYIAVCYQWSGDTPQAISAFNSFLGKYPSSVFAADVRRRLAELR